MPEPATTTPATAQRTAGPCRCCRQPVCGCPDPNHRTCRGYAAPPVEPSSGPPRPSLWCPQCLEPVHPTPPDGWQPQWGPCPDHAHADGTPLCPIPTGYRLAQPQTAPTTGDPTGTGPPWPGATAAAVAGLAAATRRLTTTLHPPTGTGYGDGRAAVRALAYALAAVADCCARLEPAVTAASPEAGRRLVQATGAAEHLTTRLIDTFIYLERY